MLLSFARALGASLVILLVVAWVMDGSSSFKQCIQEKQQQAADNHPTENLGMVRFEVSIRRDCFVSFVKVHKDEVLAAFTVLLTFATIFLWFATGDLVRGAERTAKRELRAYVGISSVGIKNIAANQTPTIEIRFKNFGKTPAYKIRSWTSSVLEFPGAKEKLLNVDKKWGGTSTLNPDDSYTNIHSRNTPLHIEEADAILTDTKRMYVRGSIQYRDAFGKRRWVYFGFETNGRTLIERGQMAVSDGRNSAT
jgi:hypothetical protein